MSSIHRSRRRVLRRSPMADEINEFAASYDWPVVYEAQPSKSKGYEVNWGITPSLVLGYLESNISNDCCVVAVGTEAEAAELVIERIDEELAAEIEPVDSLLATIQAGASGDARVLARGLVRAGFGAPLECHPEFFNAFSAAVREHPEPRVRDIAIASLVFMEWPEFKPVLAEVVVSEPDLQIRERATSVLAAYDASGLQG